MLNVCYISILVRAFFFTRRYICLKNHLNDKWTSFPACLDLTAGERVGDGERRDLGGQIRLRGEKGLLLPITFLFLQLRTSKVEVLLRTINQKAFLSCECFLNGVKKLFMCGLIMLGLAHSKLFIKSPRITLRSSRPPSSLGREPTRREKRKYVFSRARKKGGEKIVWVFGARGKKLFYIPLPFSGRHFKRIVAKKKLSQHSQLQSLYLSRQISPSPWVG